MLAGGPRFGIDSSARTAWIRHTLAPRVLSQVVSTLESQSIPLLPVKGILTAHTLYDDVAARTLSDIDVRVEPRHFSAVVQIARDRGWTPLTSNPVLWTATLKVEGWEVDVESTLGPPGLCAVGVGDLLARAVRSVDPFGFPHLQPELHDHALILVLNAFKDGLRSLPWSLEDLRRIVRHPGFDADRLVARAREGRVASALWITADWLATAHASSEWAALRDRLGPRAPSARVSRTYAYVRRLGWPSKVGLLAAAGASDALVGCAAGLSLAAAGIAKGRLARSRARLSPT